MACGVIQVLLRHGSSGLGGLASRVVVASGVVSVAVWMGHVVPNDGNDLRDTEDEKPKKKRMPQSLNIGKGFMGSWLPSLAPPCGCHVGWVTTVGRVMVSFDMAVV